MGLQISLEVTAATTFDDLYRFVDHARGASVDGNTRPAIARPDDERTVLTLDLGDVNELTRPALWLSATEVLDFERALERELNQESDRGDLQVLSELLDALRWAKDNGGH